LTEHRNEVQNIEEDVHRALVSLCTHKADSKSPWAPEPDQTTALLLAWVEHENSSPWAPPLKTQVLKQAEAEGNPWLWIRAQADLLHREHERSAQSETTLPLHLEGLPGTDGLLKCALEEERELSSKQRID